MPANIEQNIKKIRELFEEELIDAYIIPHEDEFLTEYVPDHSERLAFITGFSGSAGLAIITKNKAAIFVDGRYTTQVKIQTSGKIFNHEVISLSTVLANRITGLFSSNPSKSIEKLINFALSKIESL